jgi:hypothetical protein
MYIQNWKPMRWKIKISFILGTAFLNYAMTCVEKYLSAFDVVRRYIPY